MLGDGGDGAPGGWFKIEKRGSGECAAVVQTFALVVDEQQSEKGRVVFVMCRRSSGFPWFYTLETGRGYPLENKAHVSRKLRLVLSGVFLIWHFASPPAKTSTSSTRPEIAEYCGVASVGLPLLPSFCLPTCTIHCPFLLCPPLSLGCASDCRSADPPVLVLSVYGFLYCTRFRKTKQGCLHGCILLSWRPEAKI